MLNRDYGCPRPAYPYLDVLRAENTGVKSEGCHQLEDAALAAALPKNLIVTLLQDLESRISNDKSSETNGSSLSWMICFSLDKNPANDKDSIEFSCHGETLVGTRLQKEGEKPDSASVPLETSSLHDNDDSQQLHSSTDTCTEHSRNPGSVVTSSRSSFENASNWQLLFYGRSCCPSIDPRAERALRNEDTDPWELGCQQFLDWTSVSVVSANCTIRIFRDDSCKMLLDGENSIFPPNSTKDPEKIWRWPCHSLTLNETEQNWDCTFANPDLSHGQWNFSGSWMVDCAEDTPSPHISMLQ